MSTADLTTPLTPLPTVPARTPLTVPLTERVLTALPGTRRTWVIAWSALPLLRLAMHFTLVPLAGETSELGIVATALIPVLVYVIEVPLCLWFARQLAVQADALRPTLTHLQGTTSGPWLLRGMASTRGPLLLTLIVTLAALTELFFQHGTVTLLVLPVSFLVNLAIITALWEYLAVLLGLHRLGSHALTLDPFPEDKSLGLRPIGALATFSFRMFLLAALPLVLISGRSVTETHLTSTMFVIGLGAFFVALWRLHRQMVRAKRHYLGWVSDLYARAYQPIRTGDPLDGLRDRGSLLGSLETLEKRADAIDVWPFGQATFKTIVTVATSVVIAVITRLILKSFGL